MNKAASRLKCEVCGAEVVVTKAGDGELHCCDKVMTPR